MAEDIAIVGGSIIVAGGVHDLDSFWEMLTKGVNGRSEVPSSRWDAKYVIVFVCNGSLPI